MAFERKPILTIEMILDWADSHYEQTGEWPVAGRHEPVMDAPGENWRSIDTALRKGYRCLPPGLSVARLLERERGRRNLGDLPPYRLHHILAWADAHHQRTGEWPGFDSGPIEDMPGETWHAVHSALSTGTRGLPGGSSLARLLFEHRGVRNPKDLPLLTEAMILVWADAHNLRTGDWPHLNSGVIEGAVGEIWYNIHAALQIGHRGLPGGSSMARLLAEHRGVRNIKGLPPLNEAIILAWADAHQKRTGEWPSYRNIEPIPEAPNETWRAIDAVLRCGSRGLPGGDSLPRILNRSRGRRNEKTLAPFQLHQVLAWADAHHQRTGEWPTVKTGKIPEAPGDTWLAVNNALVKGIRGLPGDSSLARLLDEHRNTDRGAAPLDETSILAWADRFHARHGNWPSRLSGSVDDQPGETWRAVNNALVKGTRGLSGRSSLAHLLSARRSMRNNRHLPGFDEETILSWADRYFARHERWPSRRSGDVDDQPGETWNAVNSALYNGTRRLAGGSSLSRLLAERRGARGVSRDGTV